jgi:hypothetical protein
MAPKRAQGAQEPGGGEGVRIVLEDLEDRATSHATARLGMVVAVWVVVVAALPFWWATTTVYRAAIPFGRIRGWKQVGAHARGWPCFVARSW